jgi:molybdate/tungstate transport system permease protein
MAATLKESAFTDSLLLTLKAGAISSFVSFFFAVPLAYILAKKDIPGKNIINSLIEIPIIIPHTSAGIALLTVFGKNFFPGNIFHEYGIDFVGTLWGIVIGMTFVSIPFLINSARMGFESVDAEYEMVARSLGASEWQTFKTISFPLAFKGILTGILLMWGRGMGEFGAVVILVYHPRIIPTFIYERFTTYGLSYAMPAASIFMIICIILFIFLRTLFTYSKKPD